MSDTTVGHNESLRKSKFSKTKEFLTKHAKKAVIGAVATSIAITAAYGPKASSEDNDKNKKDTPTEQTVPVNQFQPEQTVAQSREVQKTEIPNGVDRYFTMEVALDNPKGYNQDNYPFVTNGTTYSCSEFIEKLGNPRSKADYPTAKEASKAQADLLLSSALLRAGSLPGEGEDVTDDFTASSKDEKYEGQPGRSDARYKRVVALQHAFDVSSLKELPVTYYSSDKENTNNYFDTMELINGRHQSSTSKAIRRDHPDKYNNYRVTIQQLEPTIVGIDDNRTAITQRYLITDNYTNQPFTSNSATDLNIEVNFINLITDKRDSWSFDTNSREAGFKVIPLSLN